MPSAPEPTYKIAYLDVENSPNIGYSWAPGKWQKNIIAFKEEWYLLCFSVLWEHAPNKPETYALCDYKGYKKNLKDDAALCKKLWEVLDEADLIITHNGIETDLPKARTRIKLNGGTPPSPFKTVDTLKLARSQFFFNGNSLHDLAITLNVPHKKLETDGFDLWLDCMAGDPQRWKQMKRYNRGDVVTLREVYHELRPWHPHHPNITISSGESFLCPVCGGPTKRAGWNKMQTYKSQRFLCLSKKGKCGKYSSGKREKIQAELLKSA